MSRPVISGVIAAIIAMLTAVAYFVTTSSLEKDIITIVHITYQLK